VDERLRDEYFARVCDAVEFADANLGEDLSLARLAEVACFSPRHFHRIFTSLLGETPDDCVRRLRLQRAAGLILSREAPTMTEIAMESGFSTPALFSRNFARRFGASPTEWREGMKRQGKIKHRQAPVASGKESASSFRYLVGEDDEPGGLSERLEVGVEILRIPAFKVYCVPYLQGYDEGVSAAYSRLIRWARPRGLLSEGSRKVSIPFDNPSVTPAQRCRNYAGIVPGPRVDAEGIVPGPRVDAEGIVPGPRVDAVGIVPGPRVDAVGIVPSPSIGEPEGLSKGLVRTVELGGTYLRASYGGPGRGLHAVYRLIYEVAIPELGFVPYGGRGFIEYPDSLDPRWLDPHRTPDGPTLVHVHVRPGDGP
jgi:AraC family transcriptional regulator